MKFLTLVVLVVLVGCGGPSRPPTFPVRGLITSEGQPLEGVTVAFRPRDPSNGQRPANGKTGPDGRYELSTFTAGDGAMAGEFGVTLLKFPPVVADDSQSGDGEYVPPEGPLPPPPANVLPKRYADPKTSGMAAEVKAAGENTFDFSVDLSAD